MKIIQLRVGMVGTNCYIVYDEASRDAAVIDPGDNAPSILKAVEEENLKVRYVLLTHAHFDHILAAHAVLETTGAKYVVPEGDTWLLKRENMGEFRAFANGYTEDAPDILAGEGTKVSFGGLIAEYMNTPGHTPGSSVIRIGDCLFTGDTLFRHECGRCDLEGGDFGQMLASLKRLHDLEGDYKVLPGHEGISTLADERAHNPYMLQATGR
ncbi:MBL fold metallo-hydrolase [Agathobaculum sp.]|uniref:MBL fold metallo-hydrolase n=1 Tax=Agathobaculum sp. TaxID=2048138 RepID=UPI002A80137A|nr:MBL fold metallo-hydrolase [Agathobaculum sp.]MDY3617892.1 MBL fold metallo-hydrolase [Agathobaculum sp.]